MEVLATEDLHAVPFHALPWDDRILLDHTPVIYGLDLVTCGEDVAAFVGPALIVSGEDPRLGGTRA